MTLFLVGVIGKTDLQVKKDETSMINGFLNISRLEDDKLLIEKEDFELGPAIERHILSEASLVVNTHTVNLVQSGPSKD